MVANIYSRYEMLSPDPILVPWPDLEKADQTLNICQPILERCPAEAQHVLSTEFLHMGCFVGIRVPYDAVESLISGPVYHELS